jgi:NAD(P)-dependent dehydrogenase (short-subunit alcohol dehydrogenase family)
MKQVVVEAEKRYGPVDLLVNNAAVLAPLGFAWDVDPEEWWRIFEINIRGAYNGILAVLPRMNERRAGRIINVSSGAAETVFPYWAAYCASKAALSNLTNNMAPPLKELGIHIFALSPGGHTPIIDSLLASSAVPEGVKQPFRLNIEQDPVNTKIGASVRMLMVLASGEADGLTGRHISPKDPVDKMLNHQNVILKDDLYTLRRRTL